MSLPAPSLHLVTSRRRLAPQARTVRDELLALQQQIDDAVDAGIDVVQVREHDLPAGTLHALVSGIVSRVAGGPTRVLVNERADVALAGGAHGVHLPSAGIAADRIRQIEAGWIIGRSVHPGDAPLDRDTCDYLLFGTVFVSESKGPDTPVHGLDGLRRAVATLGRPVVAIGGLTPAVAGACLDAGAAGIAAIGVFLPVGLARDGMGARAAVAAFRSELAGRRAGSSPGAGARRRS